MTMRLARSVFVHVPRTGGMWLKAAVDRLGIPRQVLTGDVDSHLACCQLPEEWDGLPRFGFVRHPLAWLGSRWSHAVENRTPQDGRHFGIHRAFDDCVRDTFVDTVKEVLRIRPGLVGLTYSRMLAGTVRIYRTDFLPLVAATALRELDGWQGKDEDLAKIPGFNGTTGRWLQRLLLPGDLETRFLRSEEEALDIWNRSKL